MTGENAKRPTGQPNYMARRSGAVVVVGVVIYAGVTAVGAVVGDDSSDAETTAAAEASPVTVASVQGATRGTALDGTVDAASSSTTADTTTTTEPEYTGPPTPANPALVYVVGDSDAGTFGPYLEVLLDQTKLAETDLNYKVSSGLARPDFFNWSDELEQKLPEVDPDIAVVTFGGNDSQGLSLPELDSDGNIQWVVGDPVANEDEWTEEYQKRAGEIMDLLLENDREVIWVGIPNDDNPEVTAKLAIQDQAAKAAAAERPDVVFVDTWERFSGRDGGWAEFVVDPRDNVGKDVRAADGFHLNENGAEILAIDVGLEVQEALRRLGADI
jgi:hypothetical protein